MKKPYCNSVYKTQRWKTREVMVGNIGVGGANPVRIQSMTTSSTRDVEATIDQIMKLADVGCEIARITVQGMKEADSCEAIKSSLIQKGYTIPLVADIHFFPPAAMRVIDFVDKVRVNPGNYLDKRASFKTILYDDESYTKEVERLEEKFTPLVEKCKLLKRAMRIGTNHGSLSDRIMNRYGDTPRGMVESALEFARVCRKNDYHDFIFSMKSSNPKVMILAYRLLVAEMMQLGWDYPLHLGVTEAGEGEDGRVKSAMGIGSLLLDGLGDTIRVSLTEDAWKEIDPCKRLVSLAEAYQHADGVAPFVEKHRNFETITKRHVSFPKTISLHRDGSVYVTAPIDPIDSSTLYRTMGCDVQFGNPKLKIASADGIVIDGTSSPSQEQREHLDTLNKIGITLYTTHKDQSNVPVMTLQHATKRQQQQASQTRFSAYSSAASPLAVMICNETPNEWNAIAEVKPTLLFLSPVNNRLHYARAFFNWLQEHKIDIPVILAFDYTCSKEDLIIQSSAELGALLCDGLGEGVWIRAPFDVNFLRQLSFNILQAARMRTSKTEFISCPSCGRTLFDLQDVSRRIRERIAHLPGVKIAIMGCIVNGPGEMADADFGYVGSKSGMIDLYVGKECVEKDISFADADDRLVDLIKRHGRWLEAEKAVCAAFAADIDITN